MAWTTPVSPTAGTAITVAWATANVVNPLIWLRNLTGGVDPPGPGYVARSSSTTNTNWFDLTGALAGVAVVPSGLIAAFATAAAIASGWARYTAADGRMLVGAGTVFSVTWTQNTAYGSAWSHQHSTPGHVHDMGAHNHGMSTQSSGISGSGTTYATGAATNNASPGNTSTASPTTDLTSWVIPSFAVVWSQKS